MKSITLSVSKNETYVEVAKTTAYTGARMEGDTDAFDRISTTDADAEMLERFWQESCSDVCSKLKKHIVAESRDAEKFELELSLSSAFDDTLVKSMRTELNSFFVLNITAKWYTFTNKKEAGEYSLAAVAMLDGINRKACFKKRPTRPTYAFSNNHETIDDNPGTIDGDSEIIITNQ